MVRPSRISGILVAGQCAAAVAGIVSVRDTTFL
jgi:hypothetical protein